MLEIPPTEKSDDALSSDTKSEVENIDLTDTDWFEQPLEVRKFEGGLPFSKDKAAISIANKIVYIFALSLGCSFLLIGVVIYLALHRPTEVTTIIVPALGGNLFEAIKIIGTIFSPLLAFILGYYFNKDSKS